MDRAASPVQGSSPEGSARRSAELSLRGFRPRRRRAESGAVAGMRLVVPAAASANMHEHLGQSAGRSPPAFLLSSATCMLVPAWPRPRSPSSRRAQWRDQGAQDEAGGRTTARAGARRVHAARGRGRSRAARQLGLGEACAAAGAVARRDDDGAPTGSLRGAEHAFSARSVAAYPARFGARHAFADIDLGALLRWFAHVPDRVANRRASESREPP
jgi:hypothetical protein